LPTAYFRQRIFVIFAEKQFITKSFLMSGRRTEAIRNLAYRLGMDYEESDEWGLKKLLKDFHLFRKGHSRRIENLMIHEDPLLDSTFRVFDYRYVVSSNNSTRVFKQTVFFVDSKKLGLPTFWMKPENFFHRIGSLLGIEDIDFEEFPEFSNQYWLKGENEEFIRASMNEDVIKFFTVEKNWSLEGVNYFMILYQRDKLLPIRQIHDFYDKG